MHASCFEKVLDCTQYSVLECLVSENFLATESLLVFSGALSQAVSTVEPGDEDLLRLRTKILPIFPNISSVTAIMKNC